MQTQKFLVWLCIPLVTVLPVLTPANHDYHWHNEVPFQSIAMTTTSLSSYWSGSIEIKTTMTGTITCTRSSVAQ